MTQIKSIVNWCDACQTPIISCRKGDGCSLCRGKTKYLCADIRPVFPEERLLLGLLQGGDPAAYMNHSVWASGKGRYYADGQPLLLDKGCYTVANAKVIGEKIRVRKGQPHYEAFDRDAARFTAANRQHLAWLEHEAMAFIREASENTPANHAAVSFSGGKDSTVTADLAARALGDPSLVHVFGDTTLEFDSTYAYLERYRREHPMIIMKHARNSDQDFFAVCKDIGVPTQHKNWCCTMFKTAPIAEQCRRLFEREQVLTFVGIRAAESPKRAQYDRISKGTEQRKIQQQISAYPIFHWTDAEVWLYLLARGLDFNDAYRLGFKRVGCWLCPNSTLREVFLHQVYFPEKAFAWRNILLSQARQTGKPDPETCVDSMAWKRKKGGDGLGIADVITVQKQACVADEQANVYRLSRPLCDSFYSMFAPFGIVAPELGRKLVGEVLVLDTHSKLPILSIQPYAQEGHAVRIKTMNVTSHRRMQQKIVYQIRKYNACRACGKCVSVCVAGAIRIKNADYVIDQNKCTRCQKCISTKYIDAGCIMKRTIGISKQQKEAA